MAGPGFTVDYTRLFARITKGMAGFTGGPALREVADYAKDKLFSDSQQSFVKQADPTTGKSWKPSLRARVQSGQTLLDTGRLRRSVRTEGKAAGKKVTVTGGTVPLVYAAIHQFGGEIRPVRAKFLRFTLADGTRVRSKRVRIPARPYVGLTERTIGKITAKIRAIFGEATS